MRDTLDGRMKELHAQGLGKIKGADPITEEDEKRLWESGTFDTDTSQGLIYATFYYVGKVFRIRGKSEHSKLMADQFIFCEDSTKNLVNDSHKCDNDDRFLQNVTRAAAGASVGPSRCIDGSSMSRPHPDQTRARCKSKHGSPCVKHRRVAGFCTTFEGG